MRSSHVDGSSFARLCREVRAHFDQEKRYAHSVRVARLADRLAQRHGVDPAAARTAGLLHDLARLCSKEELVRECERRRLTIDPFERSHPTVLHARLGAEFARERFGVSARAVLSAIGKHTLGDADMSPLDEVIYLADALEPGRIYAGREQLERVAFRDLRDGMRAVLLSTIASTQAKGHAIAPQTSACLERYVALHA